MLVAALTECGFLRPTNIQQKTLTSVLTSENHCLVASETGNGKTLCFLIPMLQNILRLKENNVGR
jgi:superfamily II DNA/RNA helicase